MKNIINIALVGLASGNDVDVKNDWAVADYPDMEEPFMVPLNRWGGNSPENAAFAPRKEKTPLDLKFYSKYVSSSIKGPVAEGGNVWEADNAAWFEKYVDEMSTSESDTGVKDADGNNIYNRKVHTYNTDYWEFGETATEQEAEWKRAVNACGKHRLNPDFNPNKEDNPTGKQQEDVTCPNVILINTDDMAWSDLSVNNPSKVVPTPNLDRLVSKGINFRDGHSCTARCAPSRYCFMTGRASWRRGDYHYKPMYLEHGRKIMPQMFKRAGYKTFLVGKAQPTEAKIAKLMSIDHYTECRESITEEDQSGEDRRKRRDADNFQRLVYKGGAYDPAVNDLMFMDVSESTGEALDTKQQKICWYGAETYLENLCKESWSCLAKKGDDNAYNTCVNNCLNRQNTREKNAIRREVRDHCPSRQAYCTPDKTDYKNFMLQEGVVKWGYDTGFNSFSYCCYPGAAFFRDDYNIEALRSYGLYSDIRSDAHMYNDNKRVRNDWIGKNMQYLIGRTGLFKHYQGDRFRPWSTTEQYTMPDRYTHLQIDSVTDMPCAHLNEATKCANPVDVGQCDFMETLLRHLEGVAKRESFSNDRQFLQSADFEKSIKLLEASYFLMHRNSTLDFNRFAHIEQIRVLPSQSMGRKRREITGRKRTDQEKEDDKVNVLNMPDHDGAGGHFKRINPVLTAEFFDGYVNREGTAAHKATRRDMVSQFVAGNVAATIERVKFILSDEISCTDRKRRESPAPKRILRSADAKKTVSPAVAMKMLLRGSIKDFKGGQNDEIKPDMSEEEANKVRENYEFSSNMYKFIYGENEQDADNFIEGPQGAEEKPRHFHSKAEAKTFVDDVTDAFLEYQGIDPINGYQNRKPQYSDDQKSRFKLWEFAHSKNNDGSWSFKAPRTQPSFDSREVMKTFSEEAIKNFVEAKHHIEKTNQPFFMYCAYRAPHRPFSHIENYDYTRPGSFIGKAGEQLREFDDRIGLMMSALEKLGIADNTFVMFTSDNGPDGSGFANQDYAGHVRFGTFRGKKASVYEGGHRVPFLVWWPKGIHRSLWGSNYDLPVAQTDMFATFADMIKYPLPGREKCTYAFDAVSKAIPNKVKTRLMSEVKREVSDLHKLSSDPKTKAYFMNDEDAKWTLATIKTKCHWHNNQLINSASDDLNHPLDCPCANFYDTDYELYSTTMSSRCTNGAWISNDLSVCRCYPKQHDCDEGYCFTDIIAGDKLDFQTITGGRDKLNEIFYKTNAQGDLTPTGPWDEMSDGDRANFRSGLSSVAMFHQFLTLEDKTGLVVGFDGCMAEDSHSFYDAFQPSNPEKNTGKHHRRPAEIFAGKLGDLSLRMGRYKLVRFNPPKDRRTGPNAQHLRPNDQSEWPRDFAGGKNDKERPENWQDQDLYQTCTWAPAYSANMANQYFSNIVLNKRGYEWDDEINTRWMCQREFYYELWDLHANPGEKNLCTRTYSEDVWESVIGGGGYQSADNPRENAWQLVRGLGGNTVDTAMYGQKLQEGKPEKHPDPAGIGSGKESTPVPGYINDCCLLDYGDYVNTCTNSETDFCEKSKRDPISNAGEILITNANKIHSWLLKPENWEKFTAEFADDLKFTWGKRDEAAQAEFYEHLRSQSAFSADIEDEEGNFIESRDFTARAGMSLKVPASYKVPVFTRTDGNGEKVSCINVARQLYHQTVRGVNELKPTQFWTSLVATEEEGCEEDMSFMQEGFEMPTERFMKKLVPGGKFNSQEVWSQFFSDLAEIKSHSKILQKVDNHFDEHWRSESAYNIKLDPEEQKSAAYSDFIGKTLGSGKRIPTEAEFENTQKYQICKKNNFKRQNKSCFLKNLPQSPAKMSDFTPSGRKRRSTGPTRRERRATRNGRTLNVPKNKFYISAEMFVFLMDQFEPKLTGFADWAEQNYAEGYSCADSPMNPPSAYRLLSNPDIRGRFCRPMPEPENCAVPEHEGPVGNGFNIKSSAKQAERSPTFVTEQLKVKGFGKFTQFAECMKKVMLEIEGIAHMPELDEKLKHYAGSEDQALWREEAKDENYALAGLRNGLNPRSLSTATGNARNLPNNHEYMASEPTGTAHKYLHGGGSRYIQANNDEYYTLGRDII
jgi:arylsulfatase A-like enzyme